MSEASRARSRRDAPKLLRLVYPLPKEIGLPTGHTLIEMGAFIRLIVGISALLFTTIMTAVFGVGGFFFTCGLYLVIFFAFFANS